MTWSNTQKQLAVRAAKAAGISNEQRQLILGQLGQRAVYKGKLTSTSPKLTNTDFDQFMATVESFSGGQIKIKHPDGKYVFPRRKFGDLNESQCRRLRFITLHLVKHIFVSLNEKDRTASLEGWIHSRVAGGDGKTLGQLTLKQLQDLCSGLNAYAKRNHIHIQPPPPPPEPREAMKTNPPFPGVNNQSSSTQGRNDEHAHKALEKTDIPF